MSFFENTRKPAGFGGKLMVVMMNLGHSPVAWWGLHFLELAPDDKVLDCGCGGGANIRRLLKKCPQGIVKGIDYSPVSVEKTKKVNETAIADGRCAVLQGSVADMMFADNWFDAVTAFETVYFWPDLPRCFREVWRVLKPGGTFFICNESNGDTDKDEKWTKIISGMTIYQGTELKAYLEQAGLTDSPVLLVDIGSGGTTQRVLEELLHTQLYGCYLACDARLHQNLPPERAKTFLFDGCPAPLWYWVGQPMLEVLLSEPCGSTVGYRAQAGQMVPEIGKAGADNRAITAPLWQGMRAFVQRWQAGPLREVQIPPQTCIAAFLQMLQAPRMQEVRTLGEITVEDGGSWKLAAPASWGAYLHAPAQLKRDLAQARWKPAFLQRLFGVPLPYGKVYAALKHKK